jgi:hypothetical protein
MNANSSSELRVAFPPNEPDSSPMVESMAEQYRAQATRYHALADQVVDPAREALYRRLERGYLTLVDLARFTGERSAPGRRL